MVRVAFTDNLTRHVSCTAQEVHASTVRDAFDAVFSDRGRARRYVLDEHGALRKHMVVFLNGDPIADRVTLSDAVRDGDEIFVMQALSGG